MRAMILAAGFGVRMQPLTHSLPKALAPLHGRPLLAHLLEKLEKSGLTEIAVNGHYFADQIKAFLDDFRSHSDIKIYFSHEREILDTGGGIKQMLTFFSGDEPVLVHNVDILSDCNLAEIMRFHKANKCAATLVVHRRETSRPLVFDDEFKLVRRARAEDSAGLVPTFGFCGIQVIQPELFRRVQGDKFYSLDIYLQAATLGENISGFLLDSAYWRDIGRPQDILAAEDDLKNGSFALD
jgi:N-acetyl-alpha-D-muramate 1-phosphate uridylyltransferase